MFFCIFVCPDSGWMDIRVRQASARRRSPGNPGRRGDGVVQRGKGERSRAGTHATTQVEAVSVSVCLARAGAGKVLAGVVQGRPCWRIDK